MLDMCPKVIFCGHIKLQYSLNPVGGDGANCSVLYKIYFQKSVSPKPLVITVLSFLMQGLWFDYGVISASYWDQIIEQTPINKL